jgi:hypothetical protein
MIARRIATTLALNQPVAETAHSEPLEVGLEFGGERRTAGFQPAFARSTFVRQSLGLPQELICDDR